MGEPLLRAKGFGKHTTALEAVEGHDLTGKTAVVTGGNSGIGVETVRALAAAGCRVVLASRSVGAGEAVAKEIKAWGAKGEISVRQLDLADLVSVKRFGAAVAKAERGPDLLILNAGVMAPPLGRTRDGFETQMGTNHVGHQYLTELLLPGMKALGRPARVVAVSSIGHRFHRIDLDDLHYTHGKKYERWSAYGNAKLANILFAKELTRRCEGTNVTAYSLMPGAIYTNLMRHTYSAGSWLEWGFQLLLSPMRKTIPQGAATSIVAATRPDLEPGSYLSDCQVVAPAAIANDVAAARKLWATTERDIREALQRREREARAALAEAQETLALLGASA